METVLIVVLLAIVALGAVAYPILRSGAGGAGSISDADARGSERLEREIGRYRQAIRAGTVCRWCLAPNPQASRYCGECGKPLEDRGGEADQPTRERAAGRSAGPVAGQGESTRPS